MAEQLTSVRGLSGTPTFARWLAGLGLRPTDKIGDVGTGNGFTLRWAAGGGFTNLWGFDPLYAG